MLNTILHLTAIPILTTKLQTSLLIEIPLINISVIHNTEVILPGF